MLLPGVQPCRPAGCHRQAAEAHRKLEGTRCPHAPEHTHSVDDIADNEQIARREVLLHQLFFRGRHAKITTLIATQKCTALAPQIRTQALSFFVFKLRSQQELDALLDEVSALGGRKLVDS